MEDNSRSSGYSKHCAIPDSDVDKEILPESDTSGYAISDTSNCSDAASDKSGYVCFTESRDNKKSDIKSASTKKSLEKHSVKCKAKKSVALARNRLAVKCKLESQGAHKNRQKQCKTLSKVVKNTATRKRKLSPKGNISITPKRKKISTKKRTLSPKSNSCITPKRKKTRASKRSNEKTERKIGNNKNKRTSEGLLVSHRDNINQIGVSNVSKNACSNSWLFNSLLHLSQMEEEYLKPKRTGKKNGVIITESRGIPAQGDSLKCEIPKQEESHPLTEDSRHAGGIWKTLIQQQD